MKKLQGMAAAISAWMLPALVIVVLINVAARSMGQALSWPFEVSIFLFGISALLAGGQVLRDREHVAVDILPRKLSIRGRTLLKAIALVTVAVVALVLIMQGSVTAIESTRIRERSVFQTPFNPEIWWFRWMIPIGGLLLLLESIRQLFWLRTTVTEDIALDSDDTVSRGDDSDDERGISK